jgi:hypothetical protein
MFFLLGFSATPTRLKGHIYDDYLAFLQVDFRRFYVHSFQARAGT